MAYQKGKKPPNFADLKTILSQTKKLDGPSYQLIQTLLERLSQFQRIIDDQIKEIVDRIDKSDEALEEGEFELAPHAETHAEAGTDPVQITQNQVVNLVTDLANTAKLNAANIFTQPQTINATLKVTGNYLHADNSQAMILSNTVHYQFSDEYQWINKANTIVFMRLTGTGAMTVAGTITSAGLVSSEAISGPSLAISGNTVTGGLQASSIINSTGLAHGNWNPVDAGVVSGLGTVFFYNARYARVGNTVTVSGQVDGVATGGSTTSIFRMYLPLYTLLGALGRPGTGIITNSFGDTGFCDVVNSSALVIMQLRVTNAGNQTFFYHFTYETN